MRFLRPLGGEKSDIFNEKCSKLFFKIMLPVGAGSTILKKCDAKSELEHKKYERGILKLAFLMQIRNEVHRG